MLNISLINSLFLWSASPPQFVKKSNKQFWEGFGGWFSKFLQCFTLKMERDFLGLSLKEPLPMVKEEMNNDSVSKDSGFTNGAVVKWPFMNKKYVNHDGQGGIHFSPTLYPYPYPALHDVKMFSVPSEAISVSLGHPSSKNNFAIAGQTLNSATVKQPLLGGIPVRAAPHSAFPIVGAVAGMTKTCVKPCASAPKLTIFYAGTVNVFDDVSPEKAQAIMMMAGNGLSAAVQVPSLKLAVGDGVPVSPSHTGSQSGSGSSTNDEFLAAKISGCSTASVNNVDTPKVLNTTSMLPTAVPQARKASLARFLEKRKERVMNTAPYNFNKKSENVALQNTIVSNSTAGVDADALSIKLG